METTLILFKTLFPGIWFIFYWIIAISFVLIMFYSLAWFSSYNNELDEE